MFKLQLFWEGHRNLAQSSSRFWHYLKVSKFQNEFMMSSFLPKNERFFFIWPLFRGRAEILKKNCSFFGRNDDIINSFWNLLTFRRDLNARLEDDPLQTFNSFKYHLVCQYYVSLKFTVICPFLVKFCQRIFILVNLGKTSSLTYSDSPGSTCFVIYCSVNEWW